MLSQFVALHAAFAFASRFGLLLDSKITFDWTLISTRLAANIPQAHRRFQQCLTDWLRQRGLPIAYIFVTENSGRVGLHTHWVVALPPRYRPAFRQWVRRWLKREGGEDVQRKAVKVQLRSDPNELVHWLNFSYMVKGSSPSELVVGADHSPDGREITLADLIAWPCKSPGFVPFRRYGISHNLGPAQRRLGAPAGVEPAPRNPFVSRRLPSFRTAMEDGIFDVRRNYPREFVAFVRKRYPVTEIMAHDLMLLQVVEIDLRWFLARLTPTVGVLADHCRAEIAAVLDRVTRCVFGLRYAGVARARTLDAGAQRIAQHALTYALFRAADAVNEAMQKIATLPDVNPHIAASRIASINLLTECRIQVDTLGRHLGIAVRPVEGDAIESLFRLQ